MGSWVIWLIQLFEMYKPQLDFFSGWEVLKKLVALSSGLCFILLHGVKSVNIKRYCLLNNQFVYPVNCGIGDIKAITGFIWQQPTIQYVIEH